MRKNDPNIRQDAFHLWLTLARYVISQRTSDELFLWGELVPALVHSYLCIWLCRLQAVSFGEDRLTKERWQYTLEREAQRVSRLPVPSSTAPTNTNDGAAKAM